MAGRLDEGAAWRFVLAHAQGDVSAHAHGDVSAHAHGKVPADAQGDPSADATSVQVDADGPWVSSVETTAGAKGVLDIFLPLAARKRFVVAQLGQSLDGRIATESGHSHHVTGPEDRRRLHRLRALAQAVVVGAGTVECDDPRLTVRDVEGEDPVRVVLDPRGRLDPSLAVFSDGAAPTLWVRADSDARRSAPPTGGVEVVALPLAPSTGFEPGQLLSMLRERGLDRVLVEGGGVTVSHFLAAGALDRLHVTVAPLLLGSGRPSLTLPPIATLEEALRPPTRVFRLGDDVLFDVELDRARA